MVRYAVRTLGFFAAAIVGLSPALTAQVAPAAIQRVVCTTTPVAPIDAAAVALSEDGSRVALRSDFDPLGENGDRLDQVFLWDDAAGLRQLTQGSGLDDLVAGPAVSADGRRVVFGWNGDPLGENPDGGMEVFLWDEAAGLAQVTDTPEGFVARVTISPDGSRIVFEADSDPTGENADRTHELFVWGAALGLIQITDHTTIFERTHAWDTSTDGRRIAFQDSPGGLIEQIVLWDETAGVTAITASPTASSFGPAISADGRRIAFSSGADLVGENPDGNSEIFLWEEGSGLAQLTDGVGGQGASLPSISADGGRIAFSAFADLVGENPDGGSEIFLWRDGEGLQQITDWPGGALHSLAPQLSADGFRIAFDSRADLVGANPANLFKVFLWTEVAGITQVTRTTLGMSFVAGISGPGRRVAFVTRPFPDTFDPEGFEVAVADCDEPLPPPGPWLEPAAVPGFRFKVRIVGPDGATLEAVPEPDCVPETLCVSGAVPGRTEALLRVVGPRPNDQFWPLLAKFSTSTLHVWIEQVATGLGQFYVLPGAQPRVDVLPGLVDRHGFAVVPVAEARASFEADRPSAAPVRASTLEPVVDVPEPPPGPGFATPELPGFRFWVRITPRGGEPQLVREEPDCLAETLCVSGALPGRSELFARIVGPKPNGRLWPTLVRLSPSRIEVWIEQDSSAELRYYLLRAVAPASSELPGLFDRTGFLP